MTDPAATLGEYLGQLENRPVRRGDDVIDHDLIVVWTRDQRRIITGADLLGRLLRGIARTADWRFAAAGPRVVDDVSTVAATDR